MSTIVSNNTILYENRIDVEKSNIESKTQSSFSCAVLKESDKKIASLLKKTLKEWKDVVLDRRGACKIEFSSDKDKIESDRKCSEEYIDLLRFVGSYIDECIKPKENAHIRKILILRSDDNVQGLSCLTLKSNQLYVNILVAAPWNIPMHGKIAEQHTKLRLKGSGTALMLAAYKVAQDNELNKICLTPLNGSHSFYRDQIGMEEIPAKKELGEKESHFELNVSTEVPERLLKKSNGLLYNINK